MRIMKCGNKEDVNNVTRYLCVGKIFSIFLMVVLLILLVTGCAKESDRDSDEDNDAKGTKTSKREKTEAFSEQKDSEDGVGGLFGSENGEEAAPSGDQEGTKGVKNALKDLLTAPDPGEDLQEEIEATGDTVSSVEDQEDTSLNTPSEQISSPIVGTWRSGDESRPTYIGAMDSNVEYVFDADGTYSQIVVMSIDYIYQCTGYIGNYIVSEGEVLITSRFKSTFGIQQYEWQEAHMMAAASDYEPVEDEALPYEITDNEHILVNSIALYRVE